MKENSIEEDIKILEKNVESVKENSDMAFFETDEDYYFFKAVEHILSDYKRVLKENEQLRTEVNSLLKENEELKTYIMLAPNLDEMTATKYRNIQKEAYIRGRAEEQKKAEQIIYENYIPVQKVKDKIEELQKGPLKIN